MLLGFGQLRRKKNRFSLIVHKSFQVISAWKLVQSDEEVQLVFDISLKDADIVTTTYALGNYIWYSVSFMLWTFPMKMLRLNWRIRQEPAWGSLSEYRPKLQVWRYSLCLKHGNWRNILKNIAETQEMN